MDEDELRRLAKTTGFDVATLEKDYALTWLLSGTYSRDSRLGKLLILKGGTAIRKVYFPEWRLSDDLDFTVLRRTTAQQVRQYFDLVFKALRDASISRMLLIRSLQVQTRFRLMCSSKISRRVITPKWRELT
jgi:predicted nucleotidyltransferase component of viral defense system